MKLLNTLTLFATAAILFSGCDPKRVEGTKEIAAEIERRKVKHFTRNDIEAAILKAGDSIVMTAQSEMLPMLEYGLENGGVSEAMTYCFPEKYPSVELLAGYYNATVKRTSTKLRNPENKPFAEADSVLNRYEQQAKQGVLDTKGNIYPVGENKYYVYTRPIVINSQVCLKCHGEVGKTLAATDMDTLQTAYATDKATGYKMGDLRGMWQIKFPQKSIINHLTQATRKKPRKR